MKEPVNFFCEHHSLFIYLFTKRCHFPILRSLFFYFFSTTLVTYLNLSYEISYEYLLSLKKKQSRKKYPYETSTKYDVLATIFTNKNNLFLFPFKSTKNKTCGAPTFAVTTPSAILNELSSENGRYCVR